MSEITPAELNAKINALETELRAMRYSAVILLASIFIALVSLLVIIQATQTSTIAAFRAGLAAGK